MVWLRGGCWYEASSSPDQAPQRGLERGIRQILVQIAQRIHGRFPQYTRFGRDGRGRGRDLHLDLNSSNLASPCLKTGNEFCGHLAQFCRYRAIVCRDDQRLLLQPQDLAVAGQGRGGDGFVVPLQRQELAGFARKLPQLMIGCQKGVQTVRHGGVRSRVIKGIA